MADLATLEERREALREAIASGALKVVFRDREVWFQKTSDLLSALRDLDGQISAASGVRPASIIYFKSSKGL